MNRCLRATLVWAALLGAGCPSGQPRWAETAGRTGTLTFSSAPLPLTVPNRFFVSPRWLPDGSGFLVSGRGGIGLYLVRMRSVSPGTIHEVDQTYRGIVGFTQEGSALCLKRDGVYSKYALVEGRVVEWEDAEGSCAAASAGTVSGDEVLLYARGNDRITYDVYSGAVIIEDAEGKFVISDSAVSSVSVSPDGSSIAYSTGKLEDASMKIVNRTEGSVTALQGVHPSWLPDGTQVVYAVPVAKEMVPGSLEIVESDLFALNVVTGVSTRLTRTPGIAEMEPAVSPEGTRIVFADWKSGAVYAASLERRAP